MRRNIAILSSGRFHVCDLARELDAAGHQVSFYSCVPAYRTRKFGLPDRCNKSLFPYLAPLFALMRKTQNTAFQEQAEYIFIEALDALASRLVGSCEIFIGMSGMSTRTASAVRRKYGAQIWIERGSSHILTQKEILARMKGTIHGTRQVSDRAVQRELADYELADTIVVPSRHVERSFTERGTPPEKIFRNPYGVDLSMFPVTNKPTNKIPTVLMVGAWSLRKGCDLLWKACQAAQSWRLVHVGSVGDAPLPSSPFFSHREPVPQWQLAQQFKEADVFVLASREEGLSLVQMQALACGLPIVCTDCTGSEDLREELDDKRWITVVPAENIAMLQKAIEQALTLSGSQFCTRDILGARREVFSWKAYGERYAAELELRLRTRQPALASA
jgi:glycosyltransferase involved in cell wall biosynthesis